MSAFASSRGRRWRPQLEQLETREVLSAVPTAAEQLFLERLNDARANPAAYGSSIGLNLSSVAASQPLAFDTRLVEAARLHSQDMNNRGFFAHTNPDGSGPGERMAAAGFITSAWGESIAAGYPTPDDALRALIIDAGVSDLGHRRHLLAIDASFRGHSAIGVGIVQNGSGPFRHYYTIDTGVAPDPRPYLTGSVYSDLNRNGRYDIGEGLGGVNVEVQGAGSTTTFGTGGYGVQVSPGTYNVLFSGGGLAGVVTRTVSVGATNFRLTITADSATAGGTPTTGSTPPPSTSSTPSTNTGSTPAANTGSTPAASTGSTPTDSPDANSAWLAQIYQGLLGRAPGPNDYAYWLGQLGSGQSRDAVVASIINSPEYRNIDGRRWLGQAYRTLLGRDAGPADYNYWLGVLQTASREQVTAQIMESAEYRRGDAREWLPAVYQNLLGRDPGSGDFAYWLDVVQGGTTREQVIAMIVSSPEYLGRLTDGGAAWIDQLYQDLLGRRAGPADFSYWGGVLQTASRSEVALQIMGSFEYRERALRDRVTGLYGELLGREPGPGDLAYWVGQLQAGITPAGVISAFLSSPEFNTRLASQS